MSKKKKVKSRSRTKKVSFSLKTKLKLLFLGFFVVLVGLFFMTPQGQGVLNQVFSFGRLCSQKAHLKLDQVVVEGHVRTRKEDITQHLDLRQGMPIFDVDLDLKKQAVLSLPWVKSVVIERKLPSRIYIRVEEKKPIAIWQNKKQYFPIDEEGVVINDNKTVLKNILLVVGQDAPQHTPDLIKALNKYPALQKDVISAVRVGNRRWNLHLFDVTKGVKVCLPEVDIEGALARLSQEQENSDILNRDLSVIDLKLKDRFIVHAREIRGGKTKNGTKK